jgi:two-component system cell cycle response regulator
LNNLPLSLRGRFILGIGAMLVPLLLLAALGYWLFTDTVRTFDNAVEEMRGELLPLVELQSLVVPASEAALSLLGGDNPSQRQAYSQLAAQADQIFASLLQSPEFAGPARAEVESALTHWRAARGLLESRLAGANDGQDPATSPSRHDVSRELTATLAGLRHSLVLTQREINAYRDRADAAKRRVKMLIGIMFLVAIGAALAVSLWLTRRVLGPLNELEASAARLGAGDLSQRAPVRGQDELGRLAQTFNAMADQIEEIAVRDALTGLYNRRELQRRLHDEAKRALRYDRPFALLMIDADHFKAINDKHGHVAGDEVLRELAAVLTHDVRPADVVARYGGEEFSIVLPETDAAGAVAIAERIRAVIASQPFVSFAGPELRLTVSIGVAALPEDATSVTRLVEAADSALYAAKQAGRNRVCRYQRTDGQA